MPSTNPYEPSAYPPSQTALLFLDYQNFLVNMVPSPTNESLCNAVKTLLTAARENDVAILHCLADTSLEPDPTSKVAATWETQYKPLLSANPQLGIEYAAFAPTESSTDRETIHMRKPGLRSVLEPEVVSYLRDKLGVNHLILAGIATSGAVMGTMSHGTDIGFVVSVVAEACWDPSVQAHDELIKTVIPNLAWISSIEESVGYLTG
ncbi:Isochorismatase hydrolase [Xylariaceae sp. AK1471]|nr:Isochorismatase hydrolase [Xylariaceae sp. AK1471]